MAQFLPSELLALFAPGPPLEYRAPVDRRSQRPFSGVAQFVDALETRAEHEAAVAELAAHQHKAETCEQRRARRRQERAAENNAVIAEQLKRWNPHTPSATTTSNPYATLFVARLVRAQELRRTGKGVF
jgi:U1 small nuclear ribonucleoprotein